MFSDATCTAELNTTEVPALKHAHKTFIEAKKATCTEKGNRAYCIAKIVDYILQIKMA